MVVLLRLHPVHPAELRVIGIQGLAIAVLPVALAAVAPGHRRHLGRDRPVDRVDHGPDQRVAAALMRPAARSTPSCRPRVLVLGLLLGAINGSLIVVTRVPDIVVTLAMSFVWAGGALLVLETPGGGSATWLRT